MTRILCAFVLTALTCLACQTASLPSEANRLQVDHAPTPFSAAEIQQACPPGRWNLYEMASAGKPAVYQLSTFVQSDEAGAEFEAVIVDEEGEPIGDSQSDFATWAELQAHASFPTESTEILAEARETPLGSLDGWLYVVTIPVQEQETTQRFWFARAMPGPPLHVEQLVDGVQVFEMTLLDTGIDRSVIR